MEYPTGFPEASRAVVDLERVKARKRLALRRARASSLRGSPADEENLRRYILDVWSTFSIEACNLGFDGTWTVEQVRKQSEVFLRQFTHEAYFDEGHDERGRKLPEMISVSGFGGILPHVMQEYRKSSQWSRYERHLSRVAKAQAKSRVDPGKEALRPDVVDCTPKRNVIVDASIDDAAPRRSKPGPKPKPHTQVIQEILRKQPKLSASHLCRLLDTRFAGDAQVYPTITRPTFGGKRYQSWQDAYSDKAATPLIDSLVSRNRPK